MATESVLEAINWDKTQDDKDLEVWDRLTGNFWLSEKIPLSSNLPSWKTFTKDEQLMTNRVFMGLILLDALQDMVDAMPLTPDVRTPHEGTICMSITFMESVHAKSYSSIFSTLLSMEEINESLRWPNENETLQKKAETVKPHHDGDDPKKCKVVLTVLESFLFYSGLYTPIYWSSRAKLTNATDLTRSVIRDEVIHGYYVGYKYQLAMNKSSQERQDGLRDYTYSLLHRLYENEEQCIGDLYDPLGLTEDVKKFLRYNANKAFVNLGCETLFPADMADVNPVILAALSPNAGENHGFFSGSGSSYVMDEVVDTESEDWDF